MDKILAPVAVKISKLKTDPIAVLEASADMPVAILDRNKPVGYLMSAKVWEAIVDQLEEAELRTLAILRSNDGRPTMVVELEDL